MKPTLFFSVTEEFLEELRALAKRLERDDYLRKQFFQTEETRRVIEYILGSKMLTLKELCQEALASKQVND